jgi:hypothetical protein
VCETVPSSYWPYLREGLTLGKIIRDSKQADRRQVVRSFRCLPFGVCLRRQGYMNVYGIGTGEVEGSVVCGLMDKLDCSVNGGFPVG